MVRYYSFFLILIFSTLLVHSQPYGNEWINYSQTYYKFPIAANGVYRIDSLTLVNSGIPINSINPKNIQLFARGEEQHIYIKGENDGIFNVGDYIEFFAYKNDGFLDSLLYPAGVKHPNPYISFFNDTIHYYLTWNNSLNNKRYTEETDTSFSLYTPVDFFFKEELKIFPNIAYYRGAVDQNGGSDPEYYANEGWFANGFGRGQSVSYSFNTTNAYINGPLAKIDIRMSGISNFATLSPDHHVQVSFAGYSKDSIFEGYTIVDFNSTIAGSNLNSSTTPLVIGSIDDLGNASNPDYNALVYAKLKFPHNTNLENSSSYHFWSPDNPNSTKSYFNFSNVDVSANLCLYELTTHKRIPVNINGANCKTIIPNNGSEKECYLFNENQIRFISTLKPVNGIGVFTDFSSVTADSAYILITHKSLWSEAVNYKNYRSVMPNGGNHNVVLVDVEELYDQFALGISKNPISIRRFADFALDTWPTDPEYLFLLGKATYAFQYRNNPANYAATLVPSFGNPPSDILLTSGLNGNYLKPAIATGRLAAKNSTDVSSYLSKVQQYESAPTEEWMKKILHFGGGSNLTEQTTFKNYLNDYEEIIEDTSFGGKVYTFLKTTSAPVQITTSDSLKNLINNGISLMTFFGHASGTGFDVSIDAPSSYNNTGKYPFILANSCYSGDIQDASAQSASELFVLSPNKGSIGYLAATALGVPYALNQYTQNFYKNFGQTLYQKSVGKSTQKTIETIESAALNNYQVKWVCLEMTLHADPAIVINSHKKPDYEITYSDVFFDTESQIDSFQVFSVIKNIGRAVNDSFVVELKRKFPNGEEETYLKRIPATYYKDTLAFKLPIDLSRGIGLNRFSVNLDLYNEINELSENNNTTFPDIDLLIKGGAILPIYPYKYAVVSNPNIALKASTADPFSAVRNYIFELDTTDLFNSPFKQSTVINSGGGVLSWTPSLSLPDSTVYYWRVSNDSTANSDYNWRESSFQYISGKTGWSQSHFYQFKNDAYQYVRYNRQLREFDFFNNIRNVKCTNGFYPYVDWTEIKYWIDNLLMRTWTCANFGAGGVSIAIIDPISGNPWQSVRQPNGFGQYNNIHCTNNKLNTFDYYTNDVPRRQSVRNLLLNEVPNGHYVLIYSQNNPHVADDTLMHQAFESIGSGSIRTMVNTKPFIMWGKKGAPIGSAHEVIGDSIKAFINLSDTFTTKWTEGFIASEIIGPAANWGSLHWRQRALEPQTKDSIVLRVIGISTSGTETILANFPKDSTDVLNLNSYANASTYPYLKLIAYMKDDSLTTAPQLERWQVLYTPIPEAAINPLAGYTLNKDTLQEGDSIVVRLPIQNISEYAFSDSLLITYWVEDQNRVKHYLPSKLKAAPFNAGALLLDTINFNTLYFQGSNNLWVEVNPINQTHSQLEQYHFNNIAKITFNVTSDKTNPLLDVTFDGIHILNGDIVSPKPIILVQLKDENKFLALNDTSDFALFIKRPASTTLEHLFFNSTDISFIPASLPNNSCKITYKPIYSEDGKYDLIVQAKDRSSNVSGANDYKITFEVITKSTITEILNYPNPFSTSTRFVFTLTGSEIPTQFKIQILTVTGKVVREIMPQEIGPIRIGRNVTEYAWDGKDEFGDQLANGVYLYRVVTGINGSNIEKRESGADQFFTKGFGKMYLMR